MRGARLLSWLGVALLLVLVTCFGIDAGMTYDEQFQSTYGDLRVASCDRHTNDRLRYYVEHWPGASERMTVVRDDARADVFLAVTRENCHKVPGKVLHRVRRQRASLLDVIRTEQHH